ncbi:hypothetical protein A3K73_08625 [Candidatus Pacearchaeota archaeon RBG_13_36_9]|nr:MAG: hypothetical protein A3K73_08625 [Candidatus Pacearchaeota archaeon RBG_13_36_9]
MRIMSKSIKMDLDIDFEDIKEAIELSDVEHHYFIDTKNSKIIYIGGYDDNSEEELEKIDDSLIAIPKRFPDDEFEIMEQFMYSLRNFSLAQIFEKALRRNKPFRNFKNLLDKYPEIKNQWFIFQDKAIENEAIDWLDAKNIRLKNQKLIPEIEILELTSEEFNNLAEDVRDFLPIACLNCKNTKGIKARFFKVNTPLGNKAMKKEAKKIMKNKFEIGDFQDSAYPNMNLLISEPSCPKCGSKEIFWDY